MSDIIVPGLWYGFFYCEVIWLYILSVKWSNGLFYKWRINALDFSTDSSVTLSTVFCLSPICLSYFLCISYFHKSRIWQAQPLFMKYFTITTLIFFPTKIENWKNNSNPLKFSCGVIEIWCCYAVLSNKMLEL